MDLKSFFNPCSIAVVGVSHEPHKVGYIVAKNLIDQGYKGELFFINKNFTGKILGKEVYQRLSQIRKKIDLVALAIPAAAVLSCLDEIISLDIHNVIIYAAGFKEIGKEGVRLEENLRKKAEKYKINLLGPNCLGFINTKIGINTTFIKHTSPRGNIGFISQSGALGSAIVDYFNAHTNLGFLYFVSLGNKTVIDETDILTFLGQDPDTKVIAMYLEDIKDGKKFQKIAKTVSMTKPIVVLKSGRTKEGSQVAISHTGAMVGDDEIYSTVFRQNGIIRADKFYEFLEFLKLFSFGRIPKNKQVIIISNAGGAGVLLTDELVKNGLSLARISNDSIKKIMDNFVSSKRINFRNPIDLLGDASAEDYEKALNAILSEKEGGSVVVLLTPQANTAIEETARVITLIQDYCDRPLYPIFMGKKSMSRVEQIFGENKIAGFANFDYLPKILSKIVDYQDFLKRSSSYYQSEKISDENFLQIQRILKLSKNKQYLNLVDSMKVLELSGVPISAFHLAETKDDLKKIVRQIDFPVVAKIASDDITHKTEVGGVIVNIRSERELEEAFRKLKGRCLIQKMISGQEIFIGAKREAKFGIVLVLGLGGVFAELFKEISYRIFPFSYDEFENMINETKLVKLLKGFRGSKPVDLHFLYQILIKVGLLLEKFEEITEVDINPLMISEGGLITVDGRIILKQLISNPVN